MGKASAPISSPEQWPNSKNRCRSGQEAANGHLEGGAVPPLTEGREDGGVGGGESTEYNFEQLYYLESEHYN